MAVDDEILEDDYQVPAERAASIRSQVLLLKEAGWMDNLRTLVAEAGEEVSGDDSPELPGFSEKTEGLRFWRAPEGHIAAGLQATFHNNELKVSMNGDLLLELAFLPKDNEWVVYYLKEDHWDALCGWVTSLEPEIKGAKGAKTQRQSAFRARFKGAAAAAPAEAQSEAAAESPATPASPET
jgi:hypothetical protein